MDKIKYDLLSQLQANPLSLPEVYSNTETINQTHAVVKELLLCGLVSQNPVSRVLSITPGGILALEQEINICNTVRQVEELRRIADAAERHAEWADEQAKLAEQEAESARKDSRFSKIVSIISVIIAFASLAVSAFSAFFPL